MFYFVIFDSKLFVFCVVGLTEDKIRFSVFPNFLLIFWLTEKTSDRWIDIENNGLMQPYLRTE